MKKTKKTKKTKKKTKIPLGWVKKNRFFPTLRGGGGTWRVPAGPARLALSALCAAPAGTVYRQDEENPGRDCSQQVG
jgi:hypothetical protein